MILLTPICLTEVVRPYRFVNIREFSIARFDVFNLECYNCLMGL